MKCVMVSSFSSINGMIYVGIEYNKKLQSVLGNLLLFVQIFHLEINTSMLTGGECTCVNLAKISPSTSRSYNKREIGR